MKTSTKWIIGIVIGLFVVLCIAGAGFLAFRSFTGLGGVLGTRLGQSLNDGRGVPYEMMPYRDMPWRFMPMRPYHGIFGFRTGLFPRLGFIALPLLCLGFLALIILGIIALIRSQNRPKAAAVVAPAVIPMPAPSPVVEQPASAPMAEEPGLLCPNCGQPVQPGWKHCPNCGAPLQ